MKKLFFYANFRTYDEKVGITRKVREQIQAFRKLGYEVFYSGYLKNGVAIFKNEDEIIEEKKYLFRNKILNHIFRRYLLLMLCFNFISKTTINFTISYLRYHFFDMFYIKLLKELKRKNIRVIIEAHSYPVFTKNSYFNIFYILDKLYSKKACKYCDLIAAMNNYKKIWGIPTYEIENTLEIEKYSLKNYKRLQDKFILINVAFENKTHGLDRIINGLDIYYKNNPEIMIEIILIGEYSKKTINLVKKLDLLKYVHFVGKKTKEEIDEYMNKAHFAIGSLGNHRANSFYGSALKTKEYMARGIPFIYGWNEKVLKNFPFALKVPLNEEKIDLKGVLEFYKKIDNKKLPQDIRKYLLKNNCSWEEQFKNMLFCKEIK